LRTVVGVVGGQGVLISLKGRVDVERVPIALEERWNGNWWKL
jgi:hypothetical protein